MGNIIGKFISAWLKPKAAMEEVKQQGADTSIKPAIIFVLVMGLISGLISAIMGTIFPNPLVAASKATTWLAVVIVPLVSVLGSFVGAFIIWGLVDGFLKGTASQYKTSYRLLAVLAAFSPLSALLAPIPKVGQALAIIINVWATLVMIYGITVVMETPKVRTWVICGILFAFLFTLGLLARFAAQQQIGNVPSLPDFESSLGSATDTLGEESDQLGRELENLTNQAKDAVKK
ncbi:MAG: Yip1 family protein [Elusimicrobiota bacterium]